MPKLLKEHSKPVAQGIISSTLFELLRWGGSALLGYVAKHWAEIWGMSRGWAFLLWFAVFVIFALAITLVRHLLRPRGPERVRKEGEGQAVKSGDHRLKQSDYPPLPPIQIFNNPTISPTFNNSPHIDQHPVNYQTQRQSLQSFRHSPVFECDNDTRATIYGINWETKEIIREAPTLEALRELPDNITVVWVILARFYFRPDPNIDHTLYLSAHIRFSSPTNQFLKRVIDGIWDGKPLKRSTHIQQGRALELMVALVPIAEPNGTADFLYSAEFVDENHPGPWGDNYVVTPTLEIVQGKEFLLEVELLPKKTSKETFPLQPFWFKLVFEPDLKLTRTAAPVLPVKKQTESRRHEPAPNKSWIEPDIEFTNPLLVDRWVHPEFGLVVEKPESDFSFGRESEFPKVQVMLARFYYKPDRGVPPTISVKAHIAIADAEGVPIYARYDAVWDEEPEGEYKEFDTAQHHELVIALISTADEPGICTLEHRISSGEFAPQNHGFAGTEFRLRLELIGKKYDDQVLYKAFDFGLGLNPKPWMKLI